ncbi:subunit of N- oligosaccharyltransferase complex [Scheffersomyces stipitis CBS 6054]|uniref:Subunit of N-oligosaccharyltransferase complex n=1 Tax=Scheffersomyces stipitis (strain ATCC 58785 / CBS 6054 / NBRC 10063 / NRRL Y-11545) TaxID=322104 RepID=A3LQ25_PICST|nr:subunit of N- oligosaccharyltransferase complex [Scheffersomyces stipitis CBS 6054]ABN65140.2 subunit of N- oligosaccharyltransferase complex [Scheffersomyces stipitis CBS 6054]
MYGSFTYLTVVFTAFLTLVCGSSLQLQQLLLQSSDYEHNIIPIVQSDLSSLSGPRDYFTLMLLTSSDSKHQCDVCVEVQKIISRVADSWFAEYRTNSNLVFINVDIIDRENIKIFDALQITNIPHIWLFPPNIYKEHSTEKGLDFSLLEDPHYIYKVPEAPFEEQVREFARFLSENLNKSVAIKQKSPLNTFATTFIATLVIITLVKRKGPKVITQLPKKHVVTMLSVAMILLFVCGYQFSVSKGVPFVARNEKGLIFISGGTHYQFGIEVVFVAVNYLALGFAFLVLMYIGSYNVNSKSIIRSDDVKHVLIIVMNVIIYYLYSCLTSIVIRKDHDYPYSLTKLF